MSLIFCILFVTCNLLFCVLYASQLNLPIFNSLFSSSYVESILLDIFYFIRKTKMITCYACNCTFRNNLLFLNHIKVMHSSLKTFVCPEDNCNRTYSIYNSYEKHRKTKHESQEIDERVADYVKQELSLPQPSGEQTAQHLTLDSTSVDDFLMELDNEDNVDDIDDDSDEEPLPKRTFYSKKEPNLCKNFSSARDFSVVRDELLFIAKLYKYTDVPRTRVDDIIQDTSTLIQNILITIKNEMNTLFTTSQNNLISLDNITKVLDKFSKPFEHMHTESQRFSQFKNNSTFIMPENFLLGEKETVQEKNSVNAIKKVPIYAQFIPLREVFRQFFELPGMLQRTINYQNTVLKHSKIMVNITQGFLWQKNKAHGYTDKIVFPYSIYFDDYENNNPLGSHKGIGKCGAIYASVLILPPELRSKLENNFLFMLFNTRDHKNFKNRIIFSKLIDEIKFLQKHGITVSTPRGNKQIYFVFTLFLADNLGLHSVLGFNESFRSNMFCRFCLISRDAINNVFNESSCQLRSPENYKLLLAEKNTKFSGIKEECVFHDVPGFHVTDNLAVDVMHDILEGIARCDIALILDVIINKQHFVSLTELNRRIEHFSYGKAGHVNKPPPISEKQIKDHCLIMSSSENLSLIRCLCLIIGHFVPRNNEYWNLLIMMKKLVEIVVSSVIHVETPTLLADLIFEYLELHKQLFPNKLKPKHHFLIHDPKIMRAIGPIWNISCMRMESVHRVGKITSRASISRVNVCRTIALKHQLILNYRLMTQQTNNDVFCVGPTKTVSSEKIPDFEKFSHLTCKSSSNILMLTNWIRFHDKRITKDSIIVLVYEDGPCFHSVHTLIVNENSNFKIVVKQLNDCVFDEHFQAFRICNCENFSWKFISAHELMEAHISIAHKLRDGFLYIGKRWL